MRLSGCSRFASWSRGSPPRSGDSRSGMPYWGSGIFAAAALLVLEFAFETLGVHRLEARAVVQNGRGNGALHKMGASRESVLHRSFLRDGQYLDQHLWTILDEDWQRTRIEAGASVN